MKFLQYFSLSLLTFFLFSCSTSQKSTQTSAPSSYTEAIFLQINDVYEIAALDNGKKGGMPRVATILQRLRAENPNTYFVIAGDFLNPSVIGTLKFEDKTIKGRHMVDVLNYVGLDYAMLGNHEFDLDYPDFQERVNESTFKWISTDVNGMENAPFTKKDKDGYFTPFQTTEVISVPGKDQKMYKIGIFTATTPLVKKNWITYNDYMSTSVEAAKNLSENCNVVLGITHLEIKQDRALANSVPFVPLIMGGHDHDNMNVREGSTVITKADANAKSVYIHRVRFDDKTGSAKVISELVYLDEKIKEHEGTVSVVNKWKNIATESMKKQGFEPERVIKTFDTPLDGRESVVRHEQCKLGSMIAASMMEASREKAVCAFFNSGSIRIDDQVKGNLTEYDVLRIMPYGGQVVEVTLKGSLLKKVLDAGDHNKGRGGYLQRSTNISKINNEWKIANATIQDNENYVVITGAFLYSGKEAGLEFFNDKNPEIIKAVFPNKEDKNDIRNDFRKIFIQFLGKK
ncbi:MAG: bifunctional metallophosphatase/5'-nucleotidase [Saprospiraceae bacterium]